MVSIGRRELVSFLGVLLAGCTTSPESTPETATSNPTMDLEIENQKIEIGHPGLGEKPFTRIVDNDYNRIIYIIGGGDSISIDVEQLPDSQPSDQS